MNTFLIYILESTICISVFYLLFRVLMHKETSFGVNRATLLTIVVASVIVPLVQLPQLMQTPVHVELIPEFSENKIQIQNLPESENATSFEVQPSVSESALATKELTIPLETLIRYFYLAGVLVALLLFIRNVIQILLLSRKATVRQMDGYRLLIVDREVPSFAFGRSVIISQTDYDAHGPTILAHEQAHIRLNHFFDLMLLELVRTIHWFNPAVYALIGELKEIHEFQADEQTLHSGIDATQYQLLVIQKGVGPGRFALANSFNHCQIKKRISMMNKQKTSKAWRWKVATFLPLLALLLMAFGKTGENVPTEKQTELTLTSQYFSKQQVNAIQNDQQILIIECKSNGIYVNEKLCTIEELRLKAKEWKNLNPNGRVGLYESKEPQITYTKVIEVLYDEKIKKINTTIRSDGEDNLFTYEDVTQKPIFPKGDFEKWIGNEINTLHKKYNKYVEFGFSYSFIILENGSIKVLRVRGNGIDRKDINDEFESILAQMPPWSPGQYNGKTVKVKYSRAEVLQTVQIQKDKSGLSIEIRNDGNYIDNQLYSLEEIGKKAELLHNKYPDLTARLMVESYVPMSRVTEIKEILRNSKVQNVNQSIAKSILLIEIRKDGNYINNKLYTLKEITEKLKALSIKNQDKIYYIVDDPISQKRIDEVREAVNKVTENFRKLTPPPPPPPNVNDMGFRITIIKDAFRVNRKSCTLSEIEKMLEDIDPKKEFIQIDTHSTSSKELQSSLKELLEKKGISYQISWTK